MTLVVIQILRAAAAGMVVWHHARHEAGRLAAAPDPDTLLPWWAGVDLFFVISGFVIVYASGPLFAAPGGRLRFLAHRAARVPPLYWLATALFAGLALARPDLLPEAGGLVRDPGYVAAAFLFWPAARPDGSVLPLYGLGWTLNCEVFFYALFAPLLGLGRRGAVAALCAALGLLVAAGAIVPLPLPFAFWAEPVVLEFALGAALGLARAEGLRLPGLARLGLAGLGVAGLGLAGLGLAGLWPAARGAAEIGGFARPLLAGLPAGLVVAAAALGPALDRGRMAALPRPLRGLCALGDASYALYLVHPFVLRPMGVALTRITPWLGTPVPPWAAAALMLTASAGIALLVHRWVERPVTRALRARLDAAAIGWARKRVRTAVAPVPPGRGDG